MTVGLSLRRETATHHPDRGGGVMERSNNIIRLSPRPLKVVPFAWGSHSDWSISHSDLFNSHSDCHAGSHTAWGRYSCLLGPILVVSCGFWWFWLLSMMLAVVFI
jgi:hypothetical protein